MNGKLIAGFFLYGTRGVPVVRITLWLNTDNGSKRIRARRARLCTFLACWFTRRFFSSSRRCSVLATACSGVASLVSKTVNYALVYSNKKESESEGPLRPERSCFQETLLGELVRRLPVARLTLPLFRPLHRLYRLRYEFWDRPGPVILLDEVMKIAGSLLLLVGAPKGFLTSLPSFQLGVVPQPDSRRTKRKSYFQCFTFSFFSIAVI
ncbi:LOW QUALITY PROTEIN: hypothetical protein Cgig2_027390 [Carnegiea gigantea]|uniref:Uncharacterized protein n=1 Tax=Carnegiea gigantea TaxID=171969 RepID=A0A9Q1K579_9CARY|nr:LOW QUALITY PROTEIN: hypothetical protein Cgig2_027390 [Carnegiea gigantea]